MTCAEARDRFSDAVDDLMSLSERADLETHLAGCNDCRRDFDRFAATVSLMHSVQPVRAPVGFVGRVLNATTPRPWYRRLLERAFLSFPVKLPVEAAAIVLVAVGVVYLFQATPELQQAARVETTPATPGPSTPASATAPAPAPVPAPSAIHDVSPAPTQRSATMPEEVQPDAYAKASNAAAPSTKAATEVPAPAKPAAPAAGQKRTSPGIAEERAMRAADEPKALAAPAPPAAAEAPKVAAPRSAIELSRRDMSKSTPSGDSVDAVRRERAKEAPPAGAQNAPPLRLTARVADVSALLEVTDPAAARRMLASLVARHGGAELAERTDKDAAVVEIVVPRAAYPAFARDVASIGRFQVARQPTDLPESVLVSIRLAPRP